jgi:hypothetical protein
MARGVESERGMTNDIWDKWEWLLKNHPWKYEGENTRADVMLTLIEELPAVLVMTDYWDGGMPDRETVYQTGNWCIPGDTWEEAIDNAVKKAMETA